MRIARKVFPTIFALIGMLLCSEATKAAQQHVFFIPPGGGLNEVAGGGGSWQSPTTFFTGVGFVTPQNSTVTSSTAGGLLYVAFFCNFAVCAMYSSDDVNWTLTNISGASNALPPDVNSGLSGYADYNGNPRIFVGGGPSARTGALICLMDVSVCCDITADSGAPSPVSGSALLGYPWNSNAPIVFIASDQHMHQAWWKLTNDWTAGAGGHPFTTTPLTGNNGTGVFYLDPSGQLREYRYNGTNHGTELMPFTGTPSGSGLAIAVF